MTSPACQQIRDQIIEFMRSLHVPQDTVGETPMLREDGVKEFNNHWCVRGNDEQGVFASFIDRDDVIEFGLLERDGNTAVNLLHVTVVLDDDVAEVNCMAESNMDMNFDAYITSQDMAYLDKTLRFFADNLRSAAA